MIDPRIMEPPWRLFEDWLASNSKRFLHRPILISTEERHARYQFSGVANWVYLSAGDSFSFEVQYRGYDWDGIFSAAPEGVRNPDGSWRSMLLERAYEYFDQYRALEWCPKLPKPQNYKSHEELWEEVCFEPLLEWCNKVFQPGVQIAFLGLAGTVTLARVLNQYELLERRNIGYMDSLPVLNDSSGCPEQRIDIFLYAKIMRRILKMVKNGDRRNIIWLAAYRAVVSLPRILLKAINSITSAHH